MSENFVWLFIRYLRLKNYGIEQLIDPLITRLWKKGFEQGMGYLQKKDYSDSSKVVKGPRKLFWTINEQLITNRIVLEKIKRSVDELQETGLMGLVPTASKEELKNPSEAPKSLQPPLEKVKLEANEASIQKSFDSVILNRGLE